MDKEQTKQLALHYLDSYLTTADYEKNIAIDLYLLCGDYNNSSTKWLPFPEADEVLDKHGARDIID